MDAMTKTKKILIVDDEPDVLRILEKRLSSSGFEVSKAADGKSALQLVVKEKPDLVILDIDMPGMDGGEVAARMKDHETTRHIPVIFLSCLVTQKEENGNGVGDTVFMAKPYNPSRLLEEIQKLI